MINNQLIKEFTNDEITDSTIESGILLLVWRHAIR